MKQSHIHILTFLLILILHSCSSKELLEPNVGISHHSTLTFTAQPKGYIQHPVTRLEGDVTPNKFDAEDEGRIYNAYFFLFDGASASSDAQRILRVCSPAEVSNNYQVTFTLGRELINYDISDATVCFLANVSPSDISDFVVGTTTWADFENASLSITYAPVSSTGTVGVPYVDTNGDNVRDTYCLPMFMAQKINNASNIQLERLFSKVNINVSVYSPITSFDMTSCVVKNIPKKVSICQPDEATTWSTFTSEDDYESVNNTIDLTSGIVDFSFYVPEHILGGNLTTNTTQSLKPEQFNSDQRPICAEISGILLQDSNTYLADYDIYLGENSTNNFDLIRNNYYVNSILLKALNIADNRVTVSQIGSPDDDGNPIEYTNLATNGAANCYIIQDNGNYMLPAYMGAYSDLSDAIICPKGYPTLVACDNSKLNFDFMDVDQATNVILFNVSGLILNPSWDNWMNADSWQNTYGNAVIALTSEPEGKGETLWSWHLWFSPKITVPYINFELLGISQHTYPSEYVMMDRNLGSYFKESLTITNWYNVLSTHHSGPYYKYGRKEPYFTDVKNGKGTTYHGDDTYADNYSYSWATTDGKKSHTDPCPPGYRIPVCETWASSYNSSTMNFDADRFVYSGNDNTSLNPIYYPYSYQVDEEGTLQSQESDTYTDLEYNEEVEYYLGSTYATPGVARIYFDFVYDVDVVLKSGSLWGEDGSLTYSRLDTDNQSVNWLSSISIKSAKYYKGSFSWGLFSGYTFDGYDRNTVYSTDDINDITDLIEWGNWEVVSNPLTGTAIPKIEADLDNKDFRTLSQTPLAQENQELGYQIRCVKEE